jgi:hypothetical protein
MRRFLTCLAAFALSCSTTAENPLELSPAAEIQSADVTADLVTMAEVWSQDAPEILTLDLEVATAEETFVPCQSGEGCFLDECIEGADCLSGMCVEHLGEGVCTIACEEECPPGWSCGPIGIGPDVSYSCISNFTNLCRPCASGGGCKAPGGAEDVCVDYGEEGSFCGGVCKADDDCPWGFSCLTTVTVDGIGTLQCVADAGVCPCTTKSVTLALWTNCEVTNEFGSCPGKRICSEEGLSDCDAGLPASEVCDGLDNDCDGDIDEPGLIEGTLVELCDDDNDCTEDSCKGETGCSHKGQSGIECVDGNPCTVADHCEEGVCAGTTVDCDDDNICTNDSCDETGGCVFVANSAKCDDEDPCTVADQCEEGECGGVAVDCQCMGDEDCAALEDGDICNGTLVCDIGKLPHLCVEAADSQITCPAPEGPDAPCLMAMCDEVSGECSFAAGPDGAPCNDGDACSVNDSCVAGDCAGGLAANCNDGNPCTDDDCDELAGCEHLANEDPCTDGSACTVGDVCSASECAPGQPLDCNDEEPCTDDSCDPAAGCVHSPNEEGCDDGNPCTSGDHCQQGVCKWAILTDCNDENPCTADSCDPTEGCTYEAVEIPCSDGNSCTLNDSCKAGLCVPGAELNCNDSNPCTEDSCDSGLCQHLAVAGECSDSNECTQGDLCIAGECVPGADADCDDDNLCTTDSCAAATGCIHTLNSAPCDDANPCTTSDQCELGECLGKVVVNCDDENECSNDSCHPLTGCQHEANSSGCDDGNECTADDQCADSSCQPGAAVDCGDENICTDDLCDPVDGCLHTNNTAPCDDGDLCTISDKCAAGECVPGESLTCTSADPCVSGSCESNSGCLFVPQEGECSDDNMCTVGDGCANGECVAGNDELDCNDDNACTTDGCNSDDGCTHVTAEDKTSCGSGKWCQAGDCVTIQGGTFCFEGPEKAWMTGNQICETFYGLPCGPATTPTFQQKGCQGSTIDGGRGCGENPLDPYNAGSALITCGG